MGDGGSPTLTDQRFRLRRRVGEGPIGPLWRAEDVALAVPQTIRVVRGDLGANARFARALHTQARAVWLRPTHPNVACTLAFIEDEPGIGGILMMPAFEGETLARRLERDGPLDDAEATRIAGAVTGALGAAHDQGIVHGALSAHSVLLGRRNEVKLCDFGIGSALRIVAARAATGRSAHPERREATPLDPADDDRALELLLVEMRAPSEVAAEREVEDLVRVVGSSATVVSPPAAAVGEPAPTTRRPSRAPAHRAIARERPKPQTRARPRHRPLAWAAGAVARRWGATAHTGRGLGRSLSAAVRRAAIAPVEWARGGLTVLRRGLTTPARLTRIAVMRSRGRAILAGAVVLAVAVGALAVTLSGGPFPTTAPRGPGSGGSTQTPASSRPSAPAGAVAVPRVDGLTAMEAAALLSGAGLVVAAAHPTLGPAGEVIGTEPAIGKLVEPGTRIVLLVGVSPERLEHEP